MAEIFEFTNNETFQQKSDKILNNIKDEYGAHYVFENYADIDFGDRFVQIDFYSMKNGGVRVKMKSTQNGYYTLGEYNNKISWTNIHRNIQTLGNGNVTVKTKRKSKVKKLDTDLFYFENGKNDSLASRQSQILQEIQRLAGKQSGNVDNRFSMTYHGIKNDISVSQWQRNRYNGYCNDYKLRIEFSGLAPTTQEMYDNKNYKNGRFGSCYMIIPNNKSKINLKDIVTAFKKDINNKYLGDLEEKKKEKKLEIQNMIFSGDVMQEVGAGIKTDPSRYNESVKMSLDKKLQEDNSWTYRNDLTLSRNVDERVTGDMYLLEMNLAMYADKNKIYGLLKYMNDNGLIEQAKQEEQ